MIIEVLKSERRLRFFFFLIQLTGGVVHCWLVVRLSGCVALSTDRALAILLTFLGHFVVFFILY